MCVQYLKNSPETFVKRNIYRYIIIYIKKVKLQNVLTNFFSNKTRNNKNYYMLRHKAKKKLYSIIIKYL